MTELNVKLNEDDTEDSILIYKNETSEEKIMLHLDAKPRKQKRSDGKHISELLVVDLVKHIKGPYEDPRELLVQHLMKTFQYVQYVLNIMPKFDKVWLSNVVNFNWTLTKEDIRVFCKRVKDISISLILREEENKFKFDEALECEKLWIHDDSDWLDIEKLLTRENKMKHLQLCNVTEQDVNNIFTQWINGPTSVLSSVWFSVKNPTSDIVILKDISANEITDLNSERDNTNKTSKRFKINRKCDGKLAMVTIGDGIITLVA
ncbi:hypothetical protein B9Z55_023514 [Caenorhabditis nigoni]|uniref:F-box associated domain-containing protein n=1 Tax=Caenorhabditis nigoni TaxID=1611254 RepID=A0A2G5SQP9_9PELO|nr:hypothetical protein B9Z55_023514 [Caenorhabditis nigoni]